ncbi:hypothetical protein GCM10009809_05550 [Isoptericola hypogeus]|uniref:Peptidase C39-like domain-containing protein n=1 Tax=Isoptericola hypogeus TaxID=300179 RepID=A0ABP4UUG9_9MICO
MPLRLTDVLATLGLFGGPPPGPPPGRFVRPTVPDDVAAAAGALPPPARARVLDPLARDEAPPRPGRPRILDLPAGSDGAGGTGPPARQVDERTCGAAVLTMLLLAGDPRRALEVARWPAGPAEAFAEMQRTFHARTTRGVAGLPTWPAAFGTPPWGAAGAARYGPVRYAHRVVGGRTRARVLDAALAAAGAGVPVPLYTGGDLGRGVTTAVPRHVVLLSAVRDGVATLYEPSSAKLHAVPASALVAPQPAPRDRGALVAAFGGWPHVVWALLPRDARG